MVLYSDSDSSYGLLVMYTTCYPDRHHHLFSHSIHTGLDEEKKKKTTHLKSLSIICLPTTNEGYYEECIMNIHNTLTKLTLSVSQAFV